VLAAAVSLALAPALLAACGGDDDEGDEPATGATGAAGETDAAGEALLEDDFADPGSGWPTDEGVGYEAGYADGAYRMSVDNDESSYSTPSQALAGEEFEDAIVEVTATTVSADPDAGIGLTCREDSSQSHYYADVSAADGAQIGLYRDGDQKVLSEDIPAPLEPEANRLRLECVGDQLSFYVNDQPAGSARDSTFTAGLVGVQIGGAGQGVTEILFDDFTVSAP